MFWPVIFPVVGSLSTDFHTVRQGRNATQTRSHICFPELPSTAAGRQLLQVSSNTRAVGGLNALTGSCTFNSQPSDNTSKDKDSDFGGIKVLFFPEKEHEFIFFFTAALYANYFHFINTCNACNVIISHTLPAIWELAVSRWKQQVTEQQEAYWDSYKGVFL